MADRKMIFFHKPQINISCPSTGRMWLITGCAFLCVLQSSLRDGGRSLAIAITAFISALLLEFLLTRKTAANNGGNVFAKIMDGSAAATAMILSIMLPNQMHPVYAALGTAFAIIVVKYSFGGLGSNWLNPALGGWLFIRFSWTAAYEKALDNSSGSITEMLVTSVISPVDNSITEFLNSYIFSIAGVQMPSGYINLLFNDSAGIITDRGLLALLLGTIIITAVGINRGWIPLVFLTVYGFLIRLAGDAGSFWDGDILYGIFSGGTIAAAFILAAEPSSSAKLNIGIIFSVILSAVLAWFFRYKCMEYSGCFIALALVNCLTPIIRHIEEKIFFSRKKIYKNSAKYYQDKNNKIAQEKT
ncbi:MAG: RnfABCDGE type electron transport complex subunit D [Treponema sp.]|nr:RnfABCDGE type electron transport complex subunit D [Treponema sp.]MCL2251558.1 RnfABCDGE type electron transport complex subunit D [Treponema sp.]